MARTPTDPTPRLEILIAARERVEPDMVVNADEMAAIAGMTWRNLKPQVEADKDWPVIRRGQEGVAWQFDPAAVLDHMIARANAAHAARQERAERIARMAGADIAPAAIASGLDIPDLLRLDALQTNAQRRKIEQGNYVLRDEHEMVITDLLTTMQSETLATVSRLDPAGLWPPAVRAGVADAMRGLLVRLHDQLGDRLQIDLSARPKGPPNRRVGKAGAGQVHRKRA